MENLGKKGLIKKNNAPGKPFLGGEETPRRRGKGFFPKKPPQERRG